MDKPHEPVELQQGRILSSEVVEVKEEPKYPILDIAELGDIPVDLRDQLSPEDQARLSIQ
jgi:hypothetical protein